MSDPRHGKIETRSRVRLDTNDDLSRHYTPGVADLAEELEGDPAKTTTHTVRGNAVAVVSDGSALLGLGDRGPEAALPVMEGKSALFAHFADIDAWPVCIRSRDVDDVVRTVRDLAVSFGAINLEDIAAPRCFEIERRLREELDVPVFHDDQHGTAIVVLAALTNALRLTGRSESDTTVVISGAGAAGAATAWLLLDAGFAAESIVVCNSGGAVHTGRDDLDDDRRQLAEHTNTGGRTGGLKDVLDGADVFIGLSVAGVLDGSDLDRMADDPIVFALANPDPEVDPDEAKSRAAVLATGRSDYPNQINNVLVFPGVLRGLLDAGTTELSTAAQLAAARAIADRAGDDAEHIVPSVFDDQLVRSVADAVRDAG